MNYFNKLIILIILIIFTLLTFILVSCDPVKRVVKSPAKLRKVSEFVIRAGYCINDTTILLKKDTVTKEVITSYSDTFSITLTKDTKLDTIVNGVHILLDSNGLIVDSKQKLVYSTITNTKVESIRDQSLEKILKRDIHQKDSTNSQLVSLNEDCKLENSRLKFKLVLFWTIFTIVGLINIYKRLKKFIYPA